jgi:hypothetical protein
MPPSTATLAEFWRLSLRVDPKASAEAARAWAYRMIEREPAPSAEIIDVAWSKSLAALEESLKSVSGARDHQLAGKWVLRELRDKHLLENRDVQWCAQQAMHVVDAASLGDELYYRIDTLDEEAFLEATNPGYEAGIAKSQLSELLAQFPCPPLSEA